MKIIYSISVSSRIMRSLFFLIIILFLSLSGLCQSAPLNNKEFYEQLFGDYPESFYKLNENDSSTTNVIFERELWFTKASCTDSTLRFKMKLNRVSDNVMKINYSYLGCLNTSLISNRRLNYRDKPNSFINQLQSSFSPAIPANSSSTLSTPASNTVGNSPDSTATTATTATLTSQSTSSVSIASSSSVVSTSTTNSSPQTTTVATTNTSNSTLTTGPSAPIATVTITNTPSSPPTLPLAGIFYPLEIATSTYISLPSNYINVKTYNEALRWYKARNHWIIGATICTGFNYRTIEVNNNQNKNIAEVSKRDVGETYQASVPFGLYIGRAWGSHQLTLGFTSQSFGYDYAETQKDSMSWLKGTYAGTKFSIPRIQENQKVNSYGLYYAYSAHRTGVSIFFLTGFNASYRTVGSGIYVIEKPSAQFNVMKRQNSVSSAKQAYNLFSFNFKLGAGLSFKPCYRAEFRFYPVIYYGLNSIKGSELNTRFYTVGLEGGFFIKLGRIDTFE